MSLKIDCVERGTVYLTGSEDLFSEEISNKKQLEDGYIFVRKTNIPGIFTYGLCQTRNEYYGHGPGYIWASRASVMNKELDCCFYEACYRKEGTITYRTCAVDLVRLEDFLKEAGYEVDFTPIVSDTDVNFRVKEIKS